MTKTFSATGLLVGLACCCLLVLPGPALRAQDKQLDRLRSPRATVGTLLTAITVARLEDPLVIQDAAACLDLSGLQEHFTGGETVESGELVPATELLRLIGDVPGLARIMSRLGMEGGESFGHAAAALEFALEGLYLMRRLSKDTDGSTSVYGA